MKVFSKKKMFETSGDTSYMLQKELGLPITWEDVCDGKSAEECEKMGFHIHDKWLVDTEAPANEATKDSDKKNSDKKNSDKKNEVREVRVRTDGDAVVIEMLCDDKVVKSTADDTFPYKEFEMCIELLIAANNLTK